MRHGTLHGPEQYESAAPFLEMSRISNFVIIWFASLFLVHGEPDLPFEYSTLVKGISCFPVLVLPSAMQHSNEDMYVAEVEAPEMQLGFSAQSDWPVGARSPQLQMLEST